MTDPIWKVLNKTKKEIGVVYAKTEPDAKNAVLNCRLGYNIFGDEPAFVISPEGKEYRC